MRPVLPFMRGLFLDFPKDPNVTDIGDEYMFGSALLIAPVTGQRPQAVPSMLKSDSQIKDDSPP